jgi:hypothetical protein
VIGNRVAVGDVKVYYGNGTSEHIDVREHLTPGQTTVAYDLKGVHRVIDRIEMLYQTDGSYGPRATMQVFGLRADHLGNNDWPGNNGHPGNTGWEVLGKQTVGLAVDHDTIRVGSELGKYRAIRLDVAGGNIQVYSVRVTFRNGEVQELPFDRFIYSGGTSGALDLHGHRRTIDRVDLVYKSRPSFRGIIPVVTVWGLH